MRSDQEDVNVFNQLFKSGRFSHSRKVATDDVVITQNGSLVNFIDPNGSDRVVTLPPLEDGRFYVVSNIGVADELEVRADDGSLITLLLAADTALLFASDSEWMALRGWAALGVFTNTVNGLVPAPNSVAPGSLFLRDDGQWAQVQVVGIVDAFKFITDGTNTAIGSGPDTFWLRSSTDKVGITVTNGDMTFGDNANFTVNEAFVNHDLLLNFFADEHVGHSTVVLTAGTGLSGGGDITASRTFNLDLNDLTTDTPVLADTFAFYDISGTDTNKATFTTLNGILNHNSLLNYVADQHVAHSGVSMIAGSGISGGGDITTSRTFNLDLNDLVVDTIATGDFLAFYDISGADTNKITFANLNASLDHNSLLNYVADQHVAHSGVTLTAGAGLTGGGTIAASRTFDVVAAAGGGLVVNANDVGLDTTHVRNVDHSAVSIATAAGTSGLTGGGTIAATRNLSVDINGLTADAAPDGANDYLISYDASATGLKKVLMNNLPSSGFNIGGLTSATPVAADELPFNDVSVPGNRKMTIATLGDNFFPRIDAAQTGLTDTQRFQGRMNIASGPPDAIIEEQQPSGTNAGSATSGGWITRQFNALPRNINLTVANLSGGQFQLNTGSYFIKWSAPAFGVDRHKTRLQNVTDGTTTAFGTSEYSGITGVSDFTQSRSEGSMTITVAANKVFEISHRVTTTRATVGLGVAGSFGTEVYARVEIWKTA